MMYGIAFTMWFFGTNGHVTKGDTYKTEAECVQVVEAYKKGPRDWLIDAICIKAGG